MTSYVFMDESGDLGFDFSKNKTSKNFVVTCLFVQSKRPVEKIVKNIFKQFSKKEHRSHGGSLHCYKEEIKTRRKLLNELISKDVSVVSIYLNKQKVYTRLQEEKHVLYNYVTNILLDRIYTKKLIPLDKPIKLIASRRETNRFLNLNFQNYLQTQAQENHKLSIDIEICEPRQEKCLQIVDFVSWALFRKR